MDKAIEIVERAMSECSQKSKECESRGDMVSTYKLNTAWHWLNRVREDIAKAVTA